MPSLTFSARKIGALKPAPRIVDYWSDNPKEPGFGLRVRASGVKTWVLWTRDGHGKPTMVTIGRYPDKGLKDARKAAADKRAELQKGESPAEKKRAERAAQKQTFGALFASYCEYRDAVCQANPDALRSWPRVRTTLTNTFNEAKWSPVPVRDIGRREVAELITRKLLDGGPYVANRLQAYLSHLFRFAVDRDWVTANPVTGMKRGTERREEKRTRILSATEIQTLLAYLESPAPLTLSRGTAEAGVIEMPAYTAGSVKDLFRVLLLTAQRLGETSRMRWADLDLAAGTWQVPASDAKNKQAHLVPLSTPALAILKARRQAAPDDAVYVFPSSASGKADCYTWSARTAAAISRVIGVEFRAHDLRRTAASGLGELGTSTDVIDRVLNHVQKGVIAHYDFSKREAAKRAALDAWAGHVEAIRTAKLGTVVPIGRGRKRGAA